MRTWLSMIVACVAVGLALPVAAHAAESSSDATATYNLDFTLPTYGKSGCMVCHGDPNLVKISGEATSSIYVGVTQLESSAHAADLCTGCHTDFAYTVPHTNTQNGQDWESVAKLSCKNCKDHSPQFAEYNAGAHSPAGTPGQAATVTAAARESAGQPENVPLCGDCHSPTHAIPSSEDTAGQAAYQKRGLEICGGECHGDSADSYADYYHGAAYQEGQPLDAPACWDCHGTHEILPADNRRSMVNERNLVDTCGQEGCHIGVDESFIEYASFVHGRDEVVTSNPVNAFFASVRARLGGAVDTVTSWFQRG